MNVAVRSAAPESQVRGFFHIFPSMPKFRPVTARVAVIDLYAGEDHVATCSLNADGSWTIRSLEYGWIEIVAGPLSSEYLVEKYIELRREKGIAHRAEVSARKGK